ncbi:MAG: hypothetical protein HOW73_44710 [Polyangiaceae bacterium]|nr:hypothetical protein [Polyangiaceae bacterium]
MPDAGDTLLQSIAARPDSAESYIEYAALLRSNGDPRGDLIDVQLELETARGARAKELIFAEEKLLTEHAAHFYGPLAELSTKHRGSFTWRRGFIRGLAVPPESWGSKGHTVPLPLDKLGPALDHPAMRLCRELWSKRWPKRLPSCVERLHLQQAVITERLLAASHLRELDLWTMVASPPLRHERLRVLGLQLKGPALDALASAELPELETLVLRGIGSDDGEPGHVQEVLARLPARKLFLGVQSKPRDGRSGWTDGDFAALAPIAERVEGLELHCPFFSANLPCPHLRRLKLELHSRTGAPVGELDFDVLPRARELYLHVRSHQVNHTALGESFVRSELAKHVRTLHIEASRPIGALGKAPLECLEELSVMPMGSMHLDVSHELFKEDAFPGLRTLTLRMPRQLSGVVESPVASRLETLSLYFDGEAGAKTWLEARNRFPKLRTLVARGTRQLSGAVRAALLDGDHDVVWAEHDRWAHAHWFTGAGDARGFAGIV